MINATKFPESWREKAIIEVFDVKTGTTPPTKNRAYWEEGEIPWYTPADLSSVNEKIYLSESSKKITKKALKETNVNLIPKESIILSTRAPVGTLGITNQESTFNQGCKGLVPHASPDIDSRFYYYVLQHKRSELENRSSGSTFKELSKDMLESFTVPYPPEVERKKISSILTTVDEAIQKSRAATAGTERLKEGAMRELFTKGIGHIEFEKNETIGIKPKDWTVKTIIDIFEVKTGSTPSTKIKEYWKDGIIKWYTPADLSYVNEKIYTEDSEKCITKKALEETNVNLVPKDTIIISTRAPVGTLGITKQKATFNQGCKGLVPRDNPNIDSLFYYYYLLDSRKSLENRSGGSTFMELSKDMLESFPVPSPLIAEKTQIATILSTIDRKLSLQRQRTAALERLKKGLMDDLLTGRRRVVIR